MHSKKSRSWSIIFEAIKRAVRRTDRGIKIVRVDLEPGDYEISQEVMNLISDADVVLADFTRPEGTPVETKVTVKQVVSSQEIAERGVERLKRVNGEKVAAISGRQRDSLSDRVEVHVA